MKKTRLALGAKAKDKVTGFEGVITGKCTYLTGCDQYLLQPSVVNGEWKEGHWFDEGRLEPVKAKKVTRSSVSSGKPGPDKPAPIK